MAKTSKSVEPVLVLAALALLGSCSNSVNAPGGGQEQAARAQVAPTEAERRAARLLSLTNNSSLDTKSDPYERAVACIVAVSSLQQRMTDAIGMSAEQKRALVIAGQIYERKAAAAHDGASSIKADVERVRSEAEDPNELARMGVSCLRQLA